MMRIISNLMIRISAGRSAGGAEGRNCRWLKYCCCTSSATVNKLQQMRRLAGQSVTAAGRTGGGSGNQGQPLP